MTIAELLAWLFVTELLILLGGALSAGGLLWVFVARHLRERQAR